MQKSVLVPYEKYQRLLERSVTPSKDTVEVATETEPVPPPVERSEPPTSETIEPTVQQEASTPETPVQVGASPPETPVQVGENLDYTSKKKRQRRSRPPGIKDYKSMWIKLNGKL